MGRGATGTQRNEREATGAKGNAGGGSQCRGNAEGCNRWFARQALQQSAIRRRHHHARLGTMFEEAAFMIGTAADAKGVAAEPPVVSVVPMPFVWPLGVSSVWSALGVRPTDQRGGRRKFREALEDSRARGAVEGDKGITLMPTIWFCRKLQKIGLCQNI